MPLGVGGSPRGPRAALLRLRGVYSPIHYYVIVSRAAIFTSVSLTSYRLTRAPPCATPYHRRDDRKPGRPNEGRGDASGALGDHGFSAGGKVAVATPTEVLPPGVALLRATWGGALLLAPSMQPPACFPWRKGGCCTGVVGRCCDLIHLQPMVSVSLLLRD